LLILALLIFVLPLFKMFHFRALYIHPYGKIKSSSVKNKIDLYTQLPIADTTIVVTRCEHWISLENCKHNGNKCPEYPVRCNTGVGNPDYKIDFFNQKGTNKYLNWLWFGAVGGFFAWVLTAFILEVISLKPLSDIILKAMLETGLTTDLNISGIISTLRESITGLFVGGCLGCALGIVEELLQGFSTHSIVKILVRSIFGAIIGGIGFFIGNVFFIMLFNSDYVGRLIGWLILGGILGGGLTFYSGSEFWKGMVGGFLGAITGFHLYYLSTSTTIWGIETGILIGIIFLCSTIGLIESMVISKLKDFYLQYVSGTKTGTIIPISKWIKKKDSKIIIGHAKNCHIRVYGDSNICEYHCEVHFDPEKQKVLLTPLSKDYPVEVNNRMISRTSRIKNGDIIKIGNTSFKYNENRKYFKRV
jgi:hypothetical protein